jgi:hypothetical protein
VRVVRVPVFGRRRSSNASLLSLAAYLPSGRGAALSLLARGRFDLVNSHFVPPPASSAHGWRSARLPHVFPYTGRPVRSGEVASPHAHGVAPGGEPAAGVPTRNRAVEQYARQPLTLLFVDHPVARIPLGIPAARRRRIAVASGLSPSASVLITGVASCGARAWSSSSSSCSSRTSIASLR